MVSVSIGREATYTWSVVALAGEPHTHGQCHVCWWHHPTSDMVHMGSELRQLSVLQLSEGRRWAVLAGPALQPLAVLGAHTEHRQLLISYLAWPPLLLLVGWTSSVA